MALDKEILSDEIYEKLFNLYEFRNKAVHRYFISDFEYSHIRDVIIEIDSLIQLIGEKLLYFEHKQVELGVGMTKKEDLELSSVQVKSILKGITTRIDSKKAVAIIPKRKMIFSEDEEDWE